MRHTRQGGCDFRGLGHRRRQKLTVAFVFRVRDLHRTNLYRFHSVMVGHVDRVLSRRLAERVHRIRHDLRYHETTKVPRAKGFVEEEAGLNGAKAEADEGAIARE